MAIKRQTKERASHIGAVAFCTLIYAILFLPIVIVVVNSFNGNLKKPYLTWGGLSLHWYQKLFENGPLLASFGNTMILAITTTVLATTLGTLGAAGLYRYKFRGRNLIDSLLYIPVVIPEIVMGISLLLVYVKFGVPRGMVGLIIAHVTFCVSFVIFNVRARLDGYDSSLEGARDVLQGDASDAYAGHRRRRAALVHAFHRRRRRELLRVRPGPDVPAQGHAVHQGWRHPRRQRAVYADFARYRGACRLYAERRDSEDSRARAGQALCKREGALAMTKAMQGACPADADPRFYAGSSRTGSLMDACLSRSISRRDLVRGAFGLAAGLGLAGLTGCGSGVNSKELNIFIWTEYVPDSVLEKFTKETGIKINQYLFSSNEDMLAKVRTENEGTYDILQPTDYMVKSLIRQHMLQPLDQTVMKNKRYIGSQYLNQKFDPGNKYSYPYMGSCTSIAYNKSKVKKVPKSFADMLDPEFTGKLVTLNDMREILSVCALTVGLEGNETDDASIAKIAKQAEKFKSQFKVYDSDSPRNALVSGDCIAGVIWTAEIALAQRENPDIQVVFPKEGSGIGTDNWCIPKGAKHFDNACKFINFMMRPENAKVVSEDYPYVQPNVGAIKLLDDDFKNNPVENVPAWAFKAGHRTEALPPKVLRKYDKIWTNLKG